MKKYTMLMLLMVIIGSIGALDTESYQFIDHLLALKNPGPPEFLEDPESHEDGILFTAPSTYRSVGIAFAHEGFANIYYFRKLLSARDTGEPLPANSKNARDIYRDSGILFYAFTIPRDLKILEYRLIINGLWTVDPQNPLHKQDEKTGLVHSVLLLPPIARPPTAYDGPPGSLSFSYTAPSGEMVTVAGDFNGWDPFMYELTETSPGRYNLVLPLPPGTYHYLFYYRGQRLLDPNNHSTVYTRTGDAVSEAVVR
jgi:hypothetical protein